MFLWQTSMEQKYHKDTIILHVYFFNITLPYKKKNFLIHNAFFFLVLDTVKEMLYFSKLWALLSQCLLVSLCRMISSPALWNCSKDLDVNSASDWIAVRWSSYKQKVSMIEYWNDLFYIIKWIKQLGKGLILFHHHL